MGEFFTKNQEKIAIITGYTMVFALAFGLGRIWVLQPDPPEIRIEEPDAQSQGNFNPEIQGAQSQAPVAAPAGNAGVAYPKGFPPAGADCGGGIKGSASKIYHLPGGAFYQRTTRPVICFNNEADAQASGFRKSAR